MPTVLAEVAGPVVGPTTAEGTGVDSEQLRLALDALWVGKETEEVTEEE